MGDDLALERILEQSDSTGDVYRVEDEYGNTMGWEITDNDGPNPLSPYEPLDRPKSVKPLPVVAHGDFTRKQTVIYAGVVTFVSSVAAQVIGHFFLS